MSIRSFQFTFDGSNKTVLRGGDYFTIEESTADLDVRIKDARGNEIGFVQNVAAGFWIEVPDMGYLEVESATAQTASFIVGSGKFGVNKTTTSINGGQLTPRTLLTHYGSVVGSSLLTIVTPAANTDGIRIDNITNLPNSSSTWFTVMAKTFAPTAYNDTSARFLYAHTLAASSSAILVDKIEMPVIIPAGEGLYAQGSAANSGNLTIAYEVL